MKKLKQPEWKATLKAIEARNQAVQPKQPCQHARTFIDFFNSDVVCADCFAVIGLVRQLEGTRRLLWGGLWRKGNKLGFEAIDFSLPKYYSK